MSQQQVRVVFPHAVAASDSELHCLCLINFACGKCLKRNPSLCMSTLHKNVINASLCSEYSCIQV